MFNFNVVGVAALLSAMENLEDAYNPSDDWVVGTNVPYSPHQEFGTYKMSAQPHMRPGIDATRAEMGRLAIEAEDIDEFIRLTAFHLEGEVKERSPVDTGHLRASYRAEPFR